MLNLRARQYEPAINRFSQKDIVRGQTVSPLSLNRYAYCENSPVIHIDPSGQSVLDSIGNWWNTAKNTSIGQIIDNSIVKPVTSVVKKIAAVVKPVVSAVTNAVNNAIQAYQTAKQEIDAIDSSRPTSEIEKQLIWQRACANFMGDEETAEKITKQLEKIQGYDKNDWLFLSGDCLMDDSIPLSTRFAVLDILKEKQNITAEDLIDLGLYTTETRYVPVFLWVKEDVAGETASLLELSYRMSRLGTTVWQMSIEEQQMRSQQQSALLNYLGIQAGLSSVQAYNAAGSAIRMNGATVATPGYESVASDFKPFRYESAFSKDTDKTFDAVKVDTTKQIIDLNAQGNTLTAAQKSNLTTLENTINDHLTEEDFSGALRDLEGNPVPRKGGGYYNHIGEMKYSYTALQKVSTRLAGSLKNPNLSDIDRNILQSALNEATNYIKRIENLFAPYGGIN